MQYLYNLMFEFYAFTNTPVFGMWVGLCAIALLVLAFAPLIVSLIVAVFRDVEGEFVLGLYGIAAIAWVVLCFTSATILAFGGPK